MNSGKLIVTNPIFQIGSLAVNLTTFVADCRPHSNKTSTIQRYSSRALYEWSQLKVSSDSFGFLSLLCLVKFVLYLLTDMFVFCQQVWLVVPIGMLLASLYLIIAPITIDPFGSLIALAIILAGLPLYYVFIGSNLVPERFFKIVGRYRRK